MSSGQQPVASGGFGCVYRPALACKDDKDTNDDTVSYDNKVTKLMTNDAAEEELEEYKLINIVDPDAQYYPGKPEHCYAAKNETQIAAAKNCEIVEDEEFSDDEIFDEFSLLQLKDGGMDLLKFGDAVEGWPVTAENVNKIMDFWKAAKNYFDAILTYKRSSIIHHDLKAQNLLYNQTNNRALITDFGLTVTFSDELINAKNSNRLGWTWFNFPVERFLYSPANYEKYVLEKGGSINWETQVKENSSLEKTLLDPIKWFRFYSNINKTKEEIINEFQSFCVEEKARYEASESPSFTEKYNEFLSLSITKFDTYGLGFALLTFYNKCKHLITRQSVSVQLEWLFLSMVDVSCYKRPTADKALEEFEAILKLIDKADMQIYFVYGSGCNQELTEETKAQQQANYAKLADIDPENVFIKCHTTISAVDNIVKTWFGRAPLDDNEFVNDLYAELQGKINEGIKILLFGHSFGGAIVNRVAMLFNNDAKKLEQKKWKDFANKTGFYYQLQMATFGSIYIAPATSVDYMNIMNYMAIGDVAIKLNKMTEPPIDAKTFEKFLISTSQYYLTNDKKQAKKYNNAISYAEQDKCLALVETFKKKYPRSGLLANGDVEVGIQRYLNVHNGRLCNLYQVGYITWLYLYKNIPPFPSSEPLYEPPTFLKRGLLVGNTNEWTIHNSYGDTFISYLLTRRKGREPSNRIPSDEIYTISADYPAEAYFVNYKSKSKLWGQNGGTKKMGKNKKGKTHKKAKRVTRRCNKRK
uniref:Protein kinase domain-containing protein n=1 Tax=viral metagenome TaxID=1070528 RepID=A0A6C0I3V9_9ZZZZ